MLPTLPTPIRLGCSPTDFQQLINSTAWFWAEVSQLQTPKYGGPEVQKTQQANQKTSGLSLSNAVVFCTFDQKSHRSCQF